MKTSLRLAALFSSLAASVYMAQPAFAQDPAPPSVHVRFADLDLSTDHGAKLLYARLRAAANEVCDNAFDERDLALMVQKKKCYTRTLATAVDQVSQPRLFALHRQTVGSQI